MPRSEETIDPLLMVWVEKMIRDKTSFLGWLIRSLYATEKIIPEDMPGVGNLETIIGKPMSDDNIRASILQKGLGRGHRGVLDTNDTDWLLKLKMQAVTSCRLVGHHMAIGSHAVLMPKVNARASSDRKGMVYVLKSQD